MCILQIFNRNPYVPNNILSWEPRGDFGSRRPAKSRESGCIYPTRRSWGMPVVQNAQRTPWSILAHRRRKTTRKMSTQTMGGQFQCLDATQLGLEKRRLNRNTCEFHRMCILLYCFYESFKILKKKHWNSKKQGGTPSAVRPVFGWGSWVVDSREIHETCPT